MAFSLSPSNGSAAFLSFLKTTCRRSGDGLISCAGALKISLRELLADRPQFATALCAQFRVRHFELFERIEDNSGYDQASILFVVGGNNIPWRNLGARRTEAFLIGLHVLLPEFSLGNVCSAEFPVFFRFIDARQKTLSLFFFGEVEEELDDVGSVVVEVPLQIQD